MVVGTADIEGIGRPDIIWQNLIAGDVYVWQLRNDQPSQQVYLGTYSLNYRVAGIGDYNGDGKQDILWRNFSTRYVWIWLMNGLSVGEGWYAGAPNLNWQVVGTPRLRVSRFADILWPDPPAGRITVWLGTPTYLDYRRHSDPAARDRSSRQFPQSNLFPTVL